MHRIHLYRNPTEQQRNDYVHVNTAIIIIIIYIKQEYRLSNNNYNNLQGIVDYL